MKDAYMPICENCIEEVKLKFLESVAKFQPVSYNEELSPDEVSLEFYQCPVCDSEYTLDGDDNLEDA